MALTQLLDLPDEVLIDVIGPFLSVIDLVRVSMTCKRLNRVAHETTLVDLYDASASAVRSQNLLCSSIPPCWRGVGVKIVYNRMALSLSFFLFFIYR
jgi:hypothetical protein